VSGGTLKADPVQESAMCALDRLYQDIKLGARGGLAFWKKVEAIQGVYLYGGVGRGKSMLMDLFMNALPSTIAARRVHFHEFMVGVHHDLHRASMDGRDVNNALPRMAKQLAAEIRVLCFDEFHVTDITDAMILGRLFTALFKEGMIVVATSNWSPDDLYKGVLQRDLFMPFITLLKSKVETVYLDSPNDYRMQFLAQEGTYFTPLGRAADAHAEAIFTQLTAGASVLEERFEVKGRMIIVSAAGGGVARFNFAELCEQPHGAEDYLAIAARYHTVFIERVPKMGYDRRNEAKRFLLLIDALYEAKTRVVFTAAALPDRLYVGDDHAYEFQRTVSRLQEMQSVDYLGK
jgi:cell division protein ZapE